MAGNGRRTISFSEMDFVLILEGLDHVKAVALRVPDDMGKFKLAAATATEKHVRVVLAKLDQDLAKDNPVSQATR